LIDYEGNRHFIKGRSGQTLVQACQMNNVTLIKDDSNGGGGLHSAERADYYTESLFGEGIIHLEDSTRYNSSSFVADACFSRFRVSSIPRGCCK
jgi:hypothetical protein